MNDVSTDAPELKVNISYTGPRIDAGEFSAAGLLRGAQGFKRAFAEASRVLYGRSPRVKTYTRSLDFGRASFDLALTFGDVGDQGLLSLEMSRRLQNITTILLGPPTTADDQRMGALNLLRAHPGKQVYLMERSGDHMIIDFGDDIIQSVDLDEWDVALDAKVHSSIDDLLSPLTDGGLEVLVIRTTTDRRAVVVTGEDLVQFRRFA